MDMKSMTFTSDKSKEGINMETIEHLDNCQLMYLLSHQDVQFFRNGEDSYVQAKLISSPDDDANGNGDGYV